MMNMHSGQYKSGPWLLEASDHAEGIHDWEDTIPEETARQRLPQRLDPDAKFDPAGVTHALQEYIKMRSDYERNGSIHSGQYKSGPWLLEASQHLAYDIQSPAPGEPMQTKRGPAKPSSNPAQDPMGHLDSRPYDYPTMVNNLVSHYHGATDDEKKSGRLWYKAAHDLFHNFAKDNNITPERAVAYGSAFSPLTDWGDNVHHAQQFMLGYRPGDPDFSPHDWQTAHIAQQPLDSFRQQYGRDPSESDEDLHALADLHQGQWNASKDDIKKGQLGRHDIANNPEARQQWMENIQHKGMPAVLEDQARQAEAWRKDTSRSGPYNPAYSMRASGINTLGGNIQKAKNIYHSPEDVAQMFKVLGGPKISHFTDNILDDTPIDSEGYYQHPNGDWTQNKDLGGTIDSHHIRASSMPHGGWERKPYAAKNPNTDHEYDVFNRGLYDATKHINSQEADPTKHITPKQLQAIVWLKHKNDKDFFERQRNPQTGQLINHESELGGAGRPEDWQFAEKSYKSKGRGLGKGPSRAAALEPHDLQNMPPLWRKLFMSRQPQEWTDLLEAYVQHHSPDTSYHNEDPSFHESAIQSDWYKPPTPAGVDRAEPQKVGPRPRLTPRRPNAPRIVHRHKTTSWNDWYKTADTDVDGKDKETGQTPSGGSEAVTTPDGLNTGGGSGDSTAQSPWLSITNNGMPSSGGSYGGGGHSPGGGGTQGPATVVPTGSGAVPLVRSPDGTYTSSDPAWAHLINRESGGRNIIQSPGTHDVNSGGNEAFGIFQITPGTWSSHGGQGSVYNSTPEQQAQVAADILRKNPTGSDWGAGISGRENASALARGLGSPSSGPSLPPTSPGG